MALTTLKVPTELRDRIAGEARREEKTIAAFLAGLVDQWERARREEALRDAIAASPPDAEYWSDFAAFAAMDAELPGE
ncbi:hypothetical protein GCM10027062_11320 [Nocardioides hungaricus]